MSHLEKSPNYRVLSWAFPMFLVDLFIVKSRKFVHFINNSIICNGGEIISANVNPLWIPLNKLTQLWFAFHRTQTPPLTTCTAFNAESRLMWVTIIAWEQNIHCLQLCTKWCLCVTSLRTIMTACTNMTSPQPQMLSWVKTHVSTGLWWGHAKDQETTNLIWYT